MHKIKLLITVAFAVCLTACASGPASASGSSSKNSKEPVWVSNPRAVYSETQYVSAVGYGADRESAEKNSLGALIAIFGQSVKGDTTVSSRYVEAVRNGTVQVSENSDINKAVKSSFALDSVVGAEIKDTWNNGKVFWAVAVMDKMKGAMLYSNLIDTNEQTIASLTDISEADANTLDAYARFDLAATIADTTGKFMNVLSVLNPAAAAAKRASGTFPGGDELRASCLHIAQNIPIGIVVTDDRDGRVASAFSAAISLAGFKTGGQNSRYVLNVKITLTPVDLPNNTNKFTRYIVDAKLTDTVRQSVLLPYSLSGREGHATMSEAENRAVRAIEQTVSSEYSKALSDYLAQLSAKKD